ncbi:MAG: transglutaminase domain-containing protein [Sphingobacteriaceae bacterium]|nr:transglutaminase domain-containing protein [Sphingobacteriaceae bacterium]
MMKKINRSLIYFVLGAIFTLPLFYTNSDKSKFLPPTNESYNGGLNYCTDLQASIKYIDSLSQSENSAKFDTLLYVEAASNFIKERFYHGTANYMFSENWIANLLGKYVWSHFYAIVIPDDILKRPKGLCSQQTTVFMELLKAKNIKTRKVGIASNNGNGHFFCEVFYNNSWHTYDVNLEPNWNKISHPQESMEYYLHNKDSLYLVYENKIPTPELKDMLENVEYGEPNNFPAKKMRAFHYFTKALIFALPAFFFLCGIIAFKRRV